MLEAAWSSESRNIEDRRWISAVRVGGELRGPVGDGGLAVAGSEPPAEDSWEQSAV